MPIIQLHIQGMTHHDIVTLSFMNQDARQLNAVKPSRQDEKVFAECRTIVTALAQELGKIANPQT